MTRAGFLAIAAMVFGTSCSDEANPGSELLTHRGGAGKDEPSTPSPEDKRAAPPEFIKELKQDSLVSKFERQSLDKSGNKYVLEEAEGRIRKLDPQGQKVGQRWDSASIHLRAPLGLAIDGTGVVYVADEDRGPRVVSFDSAGNYLRQWVSAGREDRAFPYPFVDKVGDAIKADASRRGSVELAPVTSPAPAVCEATPALCPTPTAVALTNEGQVLIANPIRNTIAVFDADGEFIREWASPGQGPGEFDAPRGLAVDSVGNIYVVDSGNARIQKFDRDAKFVAQWGEFGDGEGQFVDPRGIAIDSNDDVYVVDSGNSRVQKFDGDGTFRRSWGAYGSGEGEFTRPYGIAIGKDDTVFVSDALGAGVQVFSPDGEFLRGWGTFGQDEGQLMYPAGIAVDAEEHIYVADPFNRRIQMYDHRGVPLVSWRMDGIEAEEVSRPVALAADSSGRIFVADAALGSVQMFGPPQNPWASQGMVQESVALTVNFPGISSVHTYVRESDGVAGRATGRVVARLTHRTDGVTFSGIASGTYDVVVEKNAMTYIADSVDCTAGPCQVTEIVSTMTVNFPGISSVHTYLRVDDEVENSAGGGSVDSRTHKSGSTSLAVLKGNYDVQVRKNAQTNIIDAVDCTGSTCLVTDIVSTMTVNFPGISSVHTYVRVPGGGTVDSRTHRSGSTSLAVLRGTYDVRVEKNAARLTTSSVDCSAATCSVDDLVSTLTVNFPGISSVHTYVRNPSGGSVDSRTHRSNSTSLAVLKGTYDVRVEKNAQSLTTPEVNCTGDTCSVSDLVSTLTVDFPGISSVHTYVRVDDESSGTASGGGVDSRTHQSGSTSLAVLRAVYDLRVQKGAYTRVVDAVDCTGASCSAGDLVAEMTVNFPGLQSVHAYVRVPDGTAGTANGSGVDQRTHRSNAVTIAVLKGTYDVRLTKGRLSGVFDNLDCNGETCTIGGSNLNVTAPASTQVRIARNGSGSTVRTGRVGGNRTLRFTSLDVGIYDLVMTQGAGTVTVENVFHVGGTTINRLHRLTVRAPAGTRATAQTSGGGSLTAGTVGGNRTLLLYVLQSPDWDLHLDQGDAQTTIDMDNSGASSTVNRLTTLTVIAPAATVVRAQTSDGNGQLTHGTVGGNRTLVLYVLRNDGSDSAPSWRLQFDQGAGQIIQDPVDASLANATVNVLHTLTLRAPAGTRATVQSNGAPLTSGTVGGNRSLILYVLRSSDWDLLLRQGAGETTTDMDNQGASSTVNRLTTVTVNAPAGTVAVAQTNGGGGELTRGTVGGNRTLNLYVLRNDASDSTPDWQMGLTQEAGSIDVAPIVASTATEQVNRLHTLRVNAPAGTVARVQTTAGNDLTHGTVGGNRTLILYVLRSDQWSLHLTQRDVVNTFSMNNSGPSSTENRLCTLTVTGPPGASVEMRQGTFLATSGTVGGNRRLTLYVVRGTYEARTSAAQQQAVDCSQATASVTFP